MIWKLLFDVKNYPEEMAYFQNYMHVVSCIWWRCQLCEWMNEWIWKNEWMNEWIVYSAT